jgi:hypothetical protein
MVDYLESVLRLGRDGRHWSAIMLLIGTTYSACETTATLESGANPRASFLQHCQSGGLRFGGILAGRVESISEWITSVGRQPTDFAAHCRNVRAAYSSASGE